jgi:isopenicillin N synthase-like dioxygenase
MTIKTLARSTASKNAVRYVYSGRKSTPLPVVDISAMLHDNAEAKLDVARHVGKAAMDTGFLYVENHSVSQHLIDEVYQFSRKFFALDNNEKLRYYIGNSPNHRGFVPLTERGDYADEAGQRAYEAFDMSLDLPVTDNLQYHASPLSGPNVWPEIEGFRDCLTRYYEAMRQLGNCLCEAFEIALDIPVGFFGQHMKFPTSQLRLIHYLAQPKQQKNVSMGAHTDYECFTVLHSKQPGLQILNKDNRWIDAPLIDGAFAVNIGDLLEAWTNKRFVATAHRVITNGAERMSIPFFMSTDYETVIEPITGSLGSTALPEYTPFIAGEHLMGQLLRDFPYLRRRYLNGEINLNLGMPTENPFERRISDYASQELTGRQSAEKK